jgi:N-methylhydantoinase A
VISPTPHKRLAVDIGGTFTDVVVEAGAQRWTRKVLTTPLAPDQAVITGTLELLAEIGVAPSEINLFIHGTTLATNAIIERKGAVTVLIATEGFRDILDIADEGRYDQYDIFIDKPVALVPRFRRLTVPERIDATGTVLRPLDEVALRALLPELDRLGAASVAVAFLHSYASVVHERRVREILAEARPGLAVTLSSEVCPEVREYERTSTAVANAYVQPLIAGYLGRLGKALTERGFRCPVYLMTSGGGLTTLETARRFPVRLVESGPAGGAILATFIAAECGENKVLSFDMGGTTAKICLIENQKPQASRSYEVDRAARFLKGSGWRRVRLHRRRSGALLGNRLTRRGCSPSADAAHADPADWKWTRPRAPPRRPGLRSPAPAHGRRTPPRVCAPGLRDIIAPPPSALGRVARAHPVAAIVEQLASEERV